MLLSIYNNTLSRPYIPEVFTTLVGQCPGLGPYQVLTSFQLIETLPTRFLPPFLKGSRVVLRIVDRRSLLILKIKKVT